MAKLLLILPMFLLFLSVPNDASAQTCIGITCNLENKCAQTQGGTYRNCCCTPVCGPGGCESCTQWCWTSCSMTQCPQCSTCQKASLSAAKTTFRARKQYVDAAWKEHIVAGIILESRSSGGAIPIYSEMVGGSTSLYGYPVGFNVRVTAASGEVVLDIVFDGNRTRGPLPEDARFTMDSAGRMKVTAIPPEAREAVEKAVAIRSVPCPVVLGLATWGLHL